MYLREVCNMYLYKIRVQDGSRTASHKFRGLQLPGVLVLQCAYSHVWLFSAIVSCHLACFTIYVQGIVRAHISTSNSVQFHSK